MTLSEAKRKEQATRALLGPRLPKPDLVRRSYDEPTRRRSSRGRVSGSSHPTRDSGGK